MSNTALVKWGLAASLCIAVGGAIVASRLPTDTQLPIHWNASGDIDGYADKWLALMTAPLLSAFITLVLYGSTRIDPRQDNINRSAPFIKMMLFALIGLFALIQVVIASYGLGIHLQAQRIIMGSCAAMFLITGNYLPKTRPNFFFGIRTPWTLSNDEIWVKTHRLAGYATVAAGVVILGISLLGPTGRDTLHLEIGVAVAAGIVPIIYSYLLWRALPNR